MGGGGGGQNRTVGSSFNIHSHGENSAVPFNNNIHGRSDYIMAVPFNNYIHGRSDYIKAGSFNIYINGRLDYVLLSKIL